MAVSINQTTNELSCKRDARRLRVMLNAALADLTALQTTANAAVTDALTNVKLKSQIFSSGGLAIKSGGSAVVKAGSAFYAVAGGTLVNKGANTDMAALVGTVTNAKFNIFCFFIDSAGTLTSAMGTEAATLAAVVFPTMPASKAMLGMVLINPTGTGNFVGGTTALDDATVVPGAVYINTPGAQDPTATQTATAASLTVAA